MTDSINADAKEKKKEYNFDKLQMYFMYPYTLEKDSCIWNISQPTVKNIVDIGESKFYETLYFFIGNTTAFRVPLWDGGVDWCKITDFELFCMQVPSSNPEVTKLLFNGVDFTTFRIAKRNNGDNTEIVLYDMETDLIVTEETYLEIREYLRTMFGIFPKVQFGRNRATKEAIIASDKEDIMYAKLTGNDNHSSALFSFISFAINHPGFKYDLAGTLDLGIYQFMDSIQRLNVYESTRALFSGMYSGFCDLSKSLKADPDLLNFAKDLSHKEKKDFNNNEDNSKTAK